MLKWKVPVTVITGYLGSGKTTLLKKIIKETDRRVAILMNEFGEIGVDTKTVAGKSIQVKELLGGCVCCTLTGELSAAIDEILKKVKPEMIVMETTGVAEPDALVTNMDGISGVRLDSVVTVVDADAFVKFPNLGHTGRVQIESADLIILNKVDLVSVDKIEEIHQALQGLNPRAEIIKATYCGVDTSLLFGIGSVKERGEHEHHDLTHVDSFVYRSDRLHSRSGFVDFVSGLPSEVYRAKGFVQLFDGTYLFNYVNGRHDLVKSDKKSQTEIVFIGSGIKKFESRTLQAARDCQV